MKRPLQAAFTVLAVLAIVATGCSRPWTNWFKRGAECDVCPGAPMVEGYDTSVPGTFAPGTTIEQLPVPPG